MRLVESYQATVGDQESGYGFVLNTIDLESLPGINIPYIQSRRMRLDLLRPLPEEETSRALAILLVAESSQDAERLLDSQSELPQDALTLARDVWASPLVPFKRSPWDLHSLAEVAHGAPNVIGAGAAVGIGYQVGLVASGGTPLVLLTVPTAMILCASAAAWSVRLYRSITRDALNIKATPPPRRAPVHRTSPSAELPIEPAARQLPPAVLNARLERALRRVSQGLRLSTEEQEVLDAAAEQWAQSGGVSTSAVKSAMGTRPAIG